MILFLVLCAIAIMGFLYFVVLEIVDRVRLLENKLEQIQKELERWKD